MEPPSSWLDFLGGRASVTWSWVGSEFEVGKQVLAQMPDSCCSKCLLDFLAFNLLYDLRSFAFQNFKWLCFIIFPHWFFFFNGVRVH